MRIESFAFALAAVGTVIGCGSYDSPKALMASAPTSQGFCYQIPGSVVRDRLVAYLEKHYGAGRQSTAVPGGNQFVSFLGDLQIIEEDTKGSYQIALEGTSGVAFVATVTGKTVSCASELNLYAKAAPWYGLFREIDSTIVSGSDTGR